ncbi:hypothetical protein [Ruixingdingia sedimenti]|uniref:Uncharacterized protein n=1 Tax=Ruixingdingia sedimenti TaxID=3073604 RepID=A0ABU1FEU3_9RHOB|nr:hypothetical protein [Xinfangfangia sp. LG-4]MDR5655428.1 hypothetical protein [Xinfangfangia sp. LG-4]
MKFVLGSAAVWWPVNVSRPDPDAQGKTITQTLKCQFLPIEQDAFLAEQERIAAIPGLRARAAAERDYLANTFQDWADVEDGDGNSVPCTADHKAAALQDGAFRAGLWRAIGEVTLGEEARLGN